MMYFMKEEHLIIYSKIPSYFRHTSEMHTNKEPFTLEAFIGRFVSIAAFKSGHFQKIPSYQRPAIASPVLK
uniref:Uncharacterized protein n=1 Tax=Anguilla anguilla TaxID=7936 RepID=A0A0E9XBY1_ANGAN